MLQDLVDVAYPIGSAARVQASSIPVIQAIHHVDKDEPDALLHDAQCRDFFQPALFFPSF